MHPLLVLFLMITLSSRGKQPFTASYIRPPAYFDTFRMELLLDRLHTMTEALEKVNHLNQMRTLPPTKENSMNRIQDSVDVAKGFLSDSKSEKQLETLSNTLSGLKQFGDIEQMVTTFAPLLTAMLSEKSSSNAD